MMEGEPASRGACPRASPPVACPSLQSHIPLVVVASLLRPCPPLGAPPYSQRPKGGGGTPGQPLDFWPIGTQAPCRHGVDVGGGQRG